VIRDSRAYYLIAYESPHPDDGKFHKVTVRVKRPRATVFARNGYWAYKRGENAIARPRVAAVPPAVQAAVTSSRTRCGPTADEPGERRRMSMPSGRAGAGPLLDAPTIGRGARPIRGGAGEPARIPPHRYARVRAFALRLPRASRVEHAVVSGRPARSPRPAADRPAGRGRAGCFGNPARAGQLGPVDYVIELTRAQR
jgi:hypothetical protein